MNKKLRFFLTRFLLLLIVIIFFFIVVEASFRIHAKIVDIDYRIYHQQLVNFNETYSPNLFLSDEQVPFRLAPFFQGISSTYDFSVVYKTNSQGLRDREYAFERDPGMKRILVFGDSNTFGHGIPYGKRFTDIAENHFSNVEIINFGVPGFGLDQKLIYFAKEGVNYLPDYAVVFILSVSAWRYSTDIYSNGSIDLRKASFSEFSSYDSTTLYRLDNQFRYQDSFLLRNSHFLSYVSYKLNIFYLKKQLGAPLPFDSNLVANFSLYFPDRETHFSILRDRTAAIAREFSKIAEENDIKLIFVSIDYHKESKPFLSQFQEDMLSYNISYYDFGEEILAASNQRPVTFKYDPHLNEYANKVIAQEFIELLEKELE
ncbi:hypothetical protein H8D36_07460 [archaeon]|nr:hypothetical protein [archaeon]